MIKKMKSMNSLMSITAAMLLCGAILTFPIAAESKQNLVPVKYNVKSSLADNIKIFTGKKIYVTLDSGKIIAGLVKEVGDHLVHLEKVEGKEYFDAVIRIESISAIDSRFRKIQR